MQRYTPEYKVAVLGAKGLRNSIVAHNCTPWHEIEAVPLLVEVLEMADGMCILMLLILRTCFE